VPANPILDFGVDKSALQYAGCGLRRPECILAERDGTLWAANAIAPDGSRQKHSASFAAASSDASRYLEGTLRNGPAFAENGGILVSNFGTHRRS
jgi:hypothetical protein